MHYLDHLAERRIAEAIERGELDALPGAGRPLAPEDDALVPPELRTAYRLLKNAGYVPPEVRCLREIGELERIVERSGDAHLRSRAAKRLALLWERLSLHTPGARMQWCAYRSRLAARMGCRDQGEDSIGAHGTP